jgi:lipopolysaccharide transport system ATP-binding protein
MTHIKVSNLFVRFPVFDANQRSLKSAMKNAATGGVILKQDSQNRSGFITYVEALHNLSFELEVGSRLGIFGHNGSGKTTLLKVLAGIYPPSKGVLEVSGSVGSFVDIAAGVDGDLTGYENIYIRGLLMGKSRADIDNERESIINFSGLGDFIGMPIRTYSSGMWARLAFSIATAFHSDIILLDEWLSVGDQIFQKKAQERLNKVIDNASILIIASQSLDLLEAQCKKIIVLEHGRMVRVIEVDR